MSLRLLLLNIGSLILRQHLRPEVIHPGLRGDGCRSMPAVAGHHDDIGESRVPESPYYIRHLRTHGVADADHCRENAADGQIQLGIFTGNALELLFLALRNPALLVFKYKVAASDDCLFPVYQGCDAVSHHILDLPVHLVVAESPAGSLRNHRVGDGVGEMLFQACCDPQHLISVPSAEGYDIRHGGAGSGESSCLVEDNGIGLCKQLQILSALYRELMFLALPHG